RRCATRSRCRVDEHLAAAARRAHIPAGPGCGAGSRSLRATCGPGPFRPAAIPLRLGRTAEGGRALNPLITVPSEKSRPQRIALVSEHASPLATLGEEDAGGQN